MTSDRYTRGWEKLKGIDGEAGERVIEALKDIATDLARDTIEFPFGDVYSRGVRLFSAAFRYCLHGKAGWISFTPLPGNMIWRLVSRSSSRLIG